MENSHMKQVGDGIPGWRSGLAPAFGPGRDPGDPGSNPTSGSWCVEPASLSAYVSASLSPSLMTIIIKIKKKKKKSRNRWMPGGMHPEGVKEQRGGNTTWLRETGFKTGFLRGPWVAQWLSICLWLRL